MEGPYPLEVRDKSLDILFNLRFPLEPFGKTLPNYVFVQGYWFVIYEAAMPNELCL